MILESKNAYEIPGDDARMMIKGAKDAKGDFWPIGTVYRPLSHGTREDARYQDVMIQGQKITFLESTK